MEMFLQMSLSSGCSALSNEIYIQSARLHINNKEFKDLWQADFVALSALYWPGTENTPVGQPQQI